MNDFGRFLAKAGFDLTTMVVAKKVYDAFFKRYERPDYKITPGLIRYDLYKEVLPREAFYFKSKGTDLRAYYYPTKSKKIIILAHGFHSGADDFLPVILYLTKNGYDVFTYDVKGTYDSKGNSTDGFCRFLIDLESAVKYVQKDRRFKGKTIYLLGHSCGGYAVTAVLNLVKGIKAVASISGFSNGFTLLMEKGSQYAGELATQGVHKDFLDYYQKHIFGKYINYLGVDGINKTKIPIFLAHGLEDEVIDYDLQSIISKRKELTNPNITYYFGTGLLAKHCSILYSENSNEYQEEVNNELKKIEKEYKRDKEKQLEEKANYLEGINHYLYSEINESLFNQILKLFKEA